MKIKKSVRSKNFNTKLAAYSATATAALALAPAADAAIQNLTTFSYDGGSSFNTTAPGLSGVGSQQFAAATAGHLIGFEGKFTMSNYHSASAFMDIRLYAGNDVLLGGGQPGCSLSLVNFTRGALLAGNIKTTKGYTAHTLAGYDGVGFGYFNPGVPNSQRTGYVGFKAIENANTYYGWLRVKITNDGSNLPSEVSLVDNGDGIFGAIENKNDPNIGTFSAGDIGPAPVPEPSVAAIGGLSLLALGAMGVREMRRRRKA